MDIFNDLLQSCEGYFHKFIDFAPKLLIALVILVAGWLLARLFAAILKRALVALNFDDLLEKAGVNNLMGRLSENFSGSKAVAKLMYFIIMLIAVVAMSEVLGLKLLTQAIMSFFGYLPRLIIAAVILIIGAYLAGWLKNMVYSAANSIGVSGAKSIANIIYYILFIFIAITALNQAGIDTEIITSNLTIILGSILLAFAISYGLASRHIAGNLLSSYYGKGKFKEGQRLRVNDVEGIVEKIDSISVTIRTENSSVVLPSRVLIEEKVEILAEPETVDEKDD